MASVTRPAWMVAVLLALTAVWLNAVHREVTEPYMDEVFHVGQARAYLAGRWTEWDEKITTPPGLYVLSTALSRPDLLGLRALNAGLLPCVGLLAYWACGSTHTAFNVALFPPLFLFSGLYYTDVASTVAVLAFWAYFVRVRAQNLVQGAFLTLLGLVALTFRQTNIFWVAVFPAGLTLVDCLGLNEPLVKNAHADDYLSFCLRVIKAVRPRHIVRLAPYMTTLACFAAFVIWNGGVVLGDKANHVATIHLAQMLYLWPYMVFFSLPVLTPYFVDFALRTLRNEPIKRPLAQLAGWSLCTALAVAIVKYSTVVHPFILADNRHYVFYVFKILLRHPMLRYLALPVYLISAWGVVQALGSVRISFVVVWTATCVLQLSTAPLVEPRYAIIPWIVWRLHVKRASWLETAWLLVINAGTGYMFLHRGFAWTQEPGKTQRFIW